MGTLTDVVSGGEEVSSIFWKDEDVSTTLGQYRVLTPLLWAGFKGHKFLIGFHDVVQTEPAKLYGIAFGNGHLVDGERRSRVVILCFRDDGDCTIAAVHGEGSICPLQDG